MGAHKCCLCSNAYGIYKDVSFYRIPRDPVLRAKWLEAIGREVKDNESVCSDHFPPEKLIYKISPRTGLINKHYEPGTVPRKEKYDDIPKTVKVYSQWSNNVCTVALNEESFQNNFEPIEIDTNHFEEDSSHIINISTTAKETSKELGDHSYYQVAPVKNNDDNISINNTLALSNEESEKHEVSDSSHVDPLALSEEEKLHHQSRNILNLESSVKSKKISNDNSIVSNLHSISKPQKKLALLRTVRYVGDLTPEHFTSPEMYFIVQKYYHKTKRTIKAMQSQINRLKKKLKQKKISNDDEKCED